MNESNKCKTAFDEVFCMKCKEGKKPLKNQIQILPENKTFLKIKAICQTCKSQMFKNYKLDDLQKVKRTFTAVQVLELYDCENPSVKTPFLNQDKNSKKECEKEPDLLNYFYEN